MADQSAFLRQTASPDMRKSFKVDFMIVGAQKCGTTTLSQILNTHPSIVCCQEKEPQFFSTCDDWRTELERYEQMFRWQKGSLHFEASTSYTFYPHRNLELWNDLYAYNPELRIIYLVRDPVERVTSAYMHSYERGFTDRSFEDELSWNPKLLNVTRYATQIKPFIHRFGPDRVRILFFEDLVRDPETLTSDLADFLGIDPDGFGDIEEIHANKSVGGHKQHHGYSDPGLLLRAIRRLAPSVWQAITDNSARAFNRKPELSLPVQRMVLYMLRSEIDELEALTGKDLSHWRETSSPNESGRGDYRGVSAKHSTEVLQ